MTEILPTRRPSSYDAFISYRLGEDTEFSEEHYKKLTDEIERLRPGQRVQLHWTHNEMLKAIETIQALQAENDRLREALERCKLECEVVEPDETDLFKNLEGWDIYSVITEALSSTPAKALEVRKAEDKCLRIGLEAYGSTCPQWRDSIAVVELQEELEKAFEELQSIKGDR